VERKKGGKKPPLEQSISVDVRNSLARAIARAKRCAKNGFKRKHRESRSSKCRRLISRDKAAYWNGRNNAGETVSSGVYFYRLKAGDFTATKKLVVLR